MVRKIFGAAAAVLLVGCGQTASITAPDAPGGGARPALAQSERLAFRNARAWVAADSLRITCETDDAPAAFDVPGGWWFVMDGYTDSPGHFFGIGLDDSPTAGRAGVFVAGELGGAFSPCVSVRLLGHRLEVAAPLTAFVGRPAGTFHLWRVVDNAGQGFTEGTIGETGKNHGFTVDELQ